MQEEGRWGNVRFRPRRLRGGVDWGDAESRFVTGLVVFIVAALLYPWYEYRVQAWLAARDLAAAAQALERQISTDNAVLQTEPTASAAARSAATEAPPAAIRIMGAMELRNGPMAIVDLAGQPLDDVAQTICLRVQDTLGTSMSGREIRVQRWRRNAPAVSVGSVRC